VIGFTCRKRRLDVEKVPCAREGAVLSNGLNPEPQRNLIERAKVVAADDGRILAAWLVGSFATGQADAYSDVDLHCLISDESADWFREHWAETATAMAGPLVLARPIPGTIGGVCLTPDWLHLDLILHARSEFDPHTVAGLEPLYDSSGDLLPKQTKPRTIVEETYFPDRTISLCLYYLGNLPVGVGRGEVVMMHGGVVTWRDLLIEVMLAENGIRNRGGNKRLNPYLTDEQRRTLESIPIPGMHMDHILDYLQVITREILHRGKALALRTATPWPQDLEDAAMANVQRHLGLDFH
jgi:hypothetical protein